MIIKKQKLLFRKKWKSAIILLLLSLFVFTAEAEAQQRFPKPEFESGYEQPSPTTPEPRTLSMEWFDVLILILVLTATTWFALKKRSRRGILWLSVFSLLYFGFYRLGCICPIGAVQNVSLALFDPVYKISITVLLFFLVPLIFALFYGRIFCAAACPLGAIQDLIGINPVSVPLWIRKALSFIAVVYLGLAVLFAATGTEFIICRYDPFVGFFRMDAPVNMIIIGVGFLALATVFARPYCRVFCPYGVLLGWVSRFSYKHLTITPEECIQCRLCEDSCPFDAIEKPVSEKKVRTGSNVRQNIRKFSIYALIIPLWMLAGGFALSKAHVFLSRANQDVYLAELMIKNPEVKDDPDNIDVQTFLESGKSMQELVKEAGIIRAEFKTGSTILGVFLGLVIGVMIINQFILRRRNDYEPHKGDCFSCGRCMDYCPVPKRK